MIYQLGIFNQGLQSGTIVVWRQSSVTRQSHILCHAPVEQATLWCHADLESMGAGTHAITTGLINLATEIWQTVDKKHRCACCCGFTLKFDIRIGAALGTEHLQGCDCFGVCSRIAWPFVCGKKNVEGCRTSTDLISPQPLAESSEVIQMCRMQVAQP